MYSSALLDPDLQDVYYLNPMAGVVDGFRWALLGGIPPSYGHIALSTASGIVALFAGVLYFRRTERSFADIV